MKKAIALSILVILVLTSCSRAVTPIEAASGKYKHCHPMK